MNYDSLVFDLDGTLTDPRVGIVSCMNHALTAMGYPARSEQEITPYIGPPLEHAMRGLSGTADAERIAQLIVAYRERYGESGYAQNTVYDGVYAMLDALRAADIKMGVCTSKYEKYAIKVLREFNLFDYFQYVSGSDYHGAKSEQLAELLAAGKISSNALMIGDRAVDLTAAQHNGLQGAGVLWGYGSQEELGSGQPVFIANNPGELVHWLLDDA